MSPENTPAGRRGSGPDEPAGERPRGSAAGGGETAQPESSAERAEEAGRMRDRVHQRQAADRTAEGGRTIASGTASPGSRSGSAARAAAPGGQESAKRSHPVITGTAAARLLGQESSGHGGGDAAGGGGERAEQQGRGARPARDGKGVDAPTSHIDRSNVPDAPMPDLGEVHHPGQTRTQPPPEPEQHTQPRVTVGARRSRGPLRAAMQVRSIDPWSALKVSLMLSVAMFLVWMVAVAIIYIVLDGMGVWDRLNTGVSDIVSDQDETSTLIGPGQVFGVAAILGVINIVLFTALSTLGAFIYNLSSDMVGGVEVTLADRD